MILTILVHFVVRLAKAVLIATGAAYLFYEMDRFQGGKFYAENTVLVFFLLVSLITALQLALDMLPVIRVVEHVHKVKANKSVPAPVVFADLLELPRVDGQTYQATMARRKPAPDIAMSDPQLARVVMFLLDGDGIASARRLAHICTPPETAKVRGWLYRRGWAKKVNNAAVINDQGREGLAALLPHLARE